MSQQQFSFLFNQAMTWFDMTETVNLALRIHSSLAAIVSNSVTASNSACIPEPALIWLHKTLLMHATNMFMQFSIIITAYPPNHLHFIIWDWNLLPFGFAIVSLPLLYHFHVVNDKIRRKRKFTTPSWHPKAPSLFLFGIQEHPT